MSCSPGSSHLPTRRLSGSVTTSEPPRSPRDIRSSLSSRSPTRRAASMPRLGRREALSVLSRSSRDITVQLAALEDATSSGRESGRSHGSGRGSVLRGRTSCVTGTVGTDAIGGRDTSRGLSSVAPKNSLSMEDRRCAADERRRRQSEGDGPVCERDDKLDRMSLGERGGSDVVTDPESLRVGR